MVTSRSRYHSSNGLQRFLHLFAGLWILMACLPSSAAAAGAVEAQLDRESVPAGNAALLTIRVSGGRAEQPDIPAVENLIVQPRGRSQQMRIVNGQTSVSVEYTYMVGSNVPGEYQIPAIGITVGGLKLSTQPLNLKVLDSGAAQPLPGVPASPPAGGEPEVDTGEDRFGFLTVELAGEGRKHAYVGEIAPVIIRAWLPENSQAQLRSGIQPEGKGFTLHNVSDQPRQSREMRDGKGYLVVTWFGGISATKAGKLPASLSVNATVAIRDPSAPKPQRQRGGPFQDPFFDDIFEDLNVPMIQKDVTLKSDDQEIEVRPLPTEGRPAGFTGAVGDFKFDGVRIPGEWKTGEPQQIAVRIGGTGNFALMKAPQVTPEDAWKAYSGKDQFTPGDQASFSGNKEFQFSAVPRKGGRQEISLSFSYFDPAAESYKTITTPVQSIQVAGNDLIEKEPPAEPAAAGPEKKVPALVGQHLKPSPSRSLVPLVEQPAFKGILGASALLCLGGGLLAILRVRRQDPGRIAQAATENATRRALDAAAQCAAANDVSGWFAAARLAVQHRLAARWNQPPQAITLAEVTARLPADSPVLRFFVEADRHEYSRPSQDGILPPWRDLLDQALSSLALTAR